MKIIEEIQIPLFADPPPNVNKLVKWKVPDGSFVSIGDVIYELEVDGLLCEVESFDTGHIKILAEEGKDYEVGHKIGIVLCDSIQNGMRSVPIHLSEDFLKLLDSRRGETSRQVFLTDLVYQVLQELPPANKTE